MVLDAFKIKRTLSVSGFNLFFLFLLNVGCQPPLNEVKKTEISDSKTRADAAKVSVLGIFHFRGSTGDMAAMHMADPFGKRRQDDIKELVDQ